MKFETMSVGDLETVIANHERLKRTDELTYAQAQGELEKRLSRALNVSVTRNAILRSARKRTFLTYGDIAKENGVPWNKAYRPIAQHLDEVMRLTFEQGGPLITSLVVNEAGRRTGALDDNSLRGFVDGAARLGIQTQNPQAFLREQQGLSFDYATRLAQTG
jgi:5-methylcytosine-specific restriction protein B